MIKTDDSVVIVTAVVRHMNVRHEQDLKRAREEAFAAGRRSLIEDQARLSAASRKIEYLTPYTASESGSHFRCDEHSVKAVARLHELWPFDWEYVLQRADSSHNYMDDHGRYWENSLRQLLDSLWPDDTKVACLEDLDSAIKVKRTF